MKNRHKIILFSNLVLAGISVGLLQNNVKADATDTAVNTENVQPAATQDAATTNLEATEVTTSNTENNTQAATNDQNVQTQANTAEATDQPITSPVVDGVVTTGNEQSNLYDAQGTRLTVSLAANSGWVTDQKLSTQAGSQYYRVSTNAFVNATDVTLTFGHPNSGVVRTQGWGAKTYTRTDTDFVDSGAASLGANTSWQYARTDDLNGLTYYMVGNNAWINSNDATTAPLYQNPAGWLQISNTQIQPEGNVGYDLYSGVEGIKVWKVRKYFGLSNSHTIYDSSVISRVRNVQANAGLPVTGVTDLPTWRAMGFSDEDWYGIDSYIAPLQTNANSSRSDHVEAMINQATKYIGQPWVSGAASSPWYGVDCSGLVTQAMYASGINPSPVGSIQHAQPGHEWNSRDMWADWRMPHIPSSQRQRGDLVFFTDPSTGIIWHVGILLDANTMIDSWPGTVGRSSIYANKGNIAGFARVFS
ncbi:NlpC/P60 family protein [Companilactobacillus mishanensis]|uniref:NlpC/P60 family protein n=1 Tax=Companilactobacillus mishanensis TaxID=2486008 RepID=UPI0012980868|nr:NlpC/P60 family protein [Companilactobacillus mishanensis]MQS89242.1 hypothetical protein [Companilactobacillus mishanensis]